MSAMVHASSANGTDRKPAWLTIVGIGEDGLNGLSNAAQRALEDAEFIVGGARHLAFLGTTRAKTMAWPSPIEQGIEAVLERTGQSVCILASGDPFHYGIGSVLARHVGAEEMACLPAPSAFSLVTARLGWAQQDCTLLSLHGRPLERILPHLQPGARIIALTWDGETPRKLAQCLAERGMGQSRFIVCEAMGGPRERCTERTAATYDDTADPLNTVAIEVMAERGARMIPLSAGLPDAMFEHDNQITKREVRAITLSTLAPRQGEVLWDIGAGSGSISIEWMLRHPANRAIAIETRSDRAARIGRNALELGVPDLKIVHGAAPEVLVGLPLPDAIFIGGGGTDPGVLDAAWNSLPVGGRLVVNAVTLETQAEIMRRYLDLGGELTKIEIARADPVGPFHGWRASMPVMQWSITKWTGSA